jgi:chemotaxis protein histidine kinase CheA
VRMKIPLTLAIIPALIVTTAGDRYAIPQVSLLELVRLEGDQARKGIELVHGAPVHRLRGRLLPLVYLNRELKVETKVQSQAAHAPNTAVGEVDFSLVRDKHRQWVNTLQDVLAEKIAMTARQAGSCRDCALGKWIYSTGLSEYGAIDEMHTLEKTHQQFHESVHSVLALKSAGDAGLAQQELQNVERLSQHIMELTSSVERKVQEFQGVNIVVLQADDRQFGLVVDEINDTEEIVVKPLSKQLKSINTYAGATIMGDGRVALILDVIGLAHCANVVGEVHDRALAEAEEKPLTGEGDACQTMLLFQSGQLERMAIDLSLVARLEEFPRDAIEIVGGEEVVQYRSEIMPLVRVAEVLSTGRSQPQESEQGPLQVVVYRQNERSVGLVIDRILDIVEESFEIQPNTSRPGVLGSAVIHKRSTEVLDIPGLLAAAPHAHGAAAHA